MKTESLLELILMAQVQQLAILTRLEKRLYPLPTGQQGAAAAISEAENDIRAALRECKALAKSLLEASPDQR